MLTRESLQAHIKEYKPPYHHHIRDAIRDKIVESGEQIISIVLDVYDNEEINDKQRKLLRNSLWAIGGQSITNLFVMRAYSDIAFLYYLKRLSTSELESLRDNNFELVQKLYNYFDENRLKYCEKHQDDLVRQLATLGLTIPDLPFDVKKHTKQTTLGIQNCPICEREPANQRWTYFWSDTEDWNNMRGRAGWVGSCDHCNIQASRILIEMN